MGKLPHLEEVISQMLFMSRVIIYGVVAWRLLVNYGYLLRIRSLP